MMGPKKIMVVEDDDMLRNVVCDELGKAYNVVPAENGEQAIERANVHKPALIILDIMLPKFDGFQVLGKLRANPDPEIANVHVIVLSNLGEEKDIKRAEELGVDSYYVKASTRIQDLYAEARRLINEMETTAA